MGGDYCCIENKLARLSVTVSNLKNSVTQLNGLTSTINTIQNNIKSLQTSVNANTSAISTLSSEISNINIGVGAGVFTGSISVSGSVDIDGSFNANTVANKFSIQQVNPVLTGTIFFTPVFQGPSYKKYLFTLYNVGNTSTLSQTVNIPFSSGNSSLITQTYSAENFTNAGTVFSQSLFSPSNQSVNTVTYNIFTSNIIFNIPSGTSNLYQLVLLEGF